MTHDYIQIKESVERMLAEASVKAGLDLNRLPFQVAIKSLHDGSRDVQITRERHRDEGEGWETVSTRECIDAQGAFTDDGIGFILEQAARRARVLRREDAIEASGGGECPWAFEIHPLSLGMLRWFGHRDEQIMAFKGTSHGALKLAIEGAELTCGETTVRITAAAMSAGRMLVEMRELRDGSVTFNHCDGLQRCSFMVNGIHLPETVTTTLGGLRLCDVIDHPVLMKLPDIVILWAKPGVNGTHFQINGDRVPLATAPDGIDVGWRDLPTSLN